MPSQSSSLFSGFFQKIGALIQWITDTAQAVIEEVQLILAIKSVIQDDFQSIVNDLRDLTAQEQDFAERVKTLRSKVIRADVIFEFIDQIRTGDLRKFCVDELQALQTGFKSSISDALQAGQNVGIIKSGQLGTTNPVIKFMNALVSVYSAIAAFVHGLETLKGVVHDIKEKLDSFEKVILQQNNPRHSVDGKHRTRIP